MNTKTFLLSSLAIGWALGLTGCSSGRFTAAAPSSAALTTPAPTNSQAADSVQYAPLACLATTPNFSLTTSIDSFSLTDGASGNVGFGGSLLQAIGLGITYSSGTLAMSMKLTSPLYGPASIANAIGSANSDSFSFSVSGIASLLTGSMSAWSTTGLAKVSGDAMISTFGNLSKVIPGTTWSTVINQELGNNQFTIPVGESSGLQAGDTFSVYKVAYIWGGNGVACQGPLEVIQKIGSAVGTATVVTAAYASSIVSIVNPTQAVHNNDHLEIKALVKAVNGSARTGLKYSLHLGSVTQAAGLLFSDGTNTSNVDMTPFVGADLSNYLSNTLGYYNVQ